MTQNEQSPFRGYKSIEEVREKVQNLDEWLRTAGKESAPITMLAKDFDLVKRWPKAAELHGFRVAGEEVTFKGRMLRRANGERRYQERRPKTTEVALDAAQQK
jgi:hypothetical protein